MSKIETTLDKIYQEAVPKCDRAIWTNLANKVYTAINLNGDVVISRSDFDTVLLYRQHQKTFYNLEIDSDLDLTFSIMPTDRTLRHKITTKFVLYKDVSEALIAELAILFNTNI